MNGFNTLHISACNFADREDFVNSISTAKQSITEYPSNLCLILDLIDKFGRSIEGQKRMIELDNLMVYSLKLSGKKRSVFSKSKSISFLFFSIS